MKTIITLIIAVLTISACKKTDPIGNYQPPIQTFSDTSDWRNNYADSGTLPNWGADTSGTLVGSTWVLTKLQPYGYTTIDVRNDTFHFVTKTTYTLNSNPYSHQYRLYYSQNIATLTFIGFPIVNYNTYSTNSLGRGFENGPEIIAARFTNDYNQNDVGFRAWFKKI